MTISEKVAHLKGVMEGMDFDASTKEGKLISLIVDVLADMSDEIDVITDDVDTLFDYCDELDEDLGMVEEDLYCGEDDEDDDDCFDEIDEEDFEEDEDDADDDKDEEDGDEEIFVITCPVCGDGVYLDDTMDFDDIKCPSCGAIISCTCESCEDCEGCGE
jgi:hypothetical protein